ncbi:MAG: hypothetical protein LQ338_004867 [Usnochroma carphineum]|nr:MAG: hypothetical protein LQ338_004867 [Usnochroma carphineum]
MDELKSGPKLRKLDKAIARLNHGCRNKLQVFDVCSTGVESPNGKSQKIEPTVIQYTFWHGTANFQSQHFLIKRKVKSGDLSLERARRPLPAPETCLASSNVGSSGVKELERLPYKAV